MKGTRIWTAAGAVALLAVLAGCGGGGDSGGSRGYVQPKGAAIATINIEAGNFYFKPNRIDAQAGINEIKLTSAGGLHDLVFSGKFPGFQLEVSGSGDSQALKADLKPGKYTFYCSIPGHRSQGMEGTITVK
jgi:uncharacterized cupredoxin-like copper-binding protein